MATSYKTPGVYVEEISVFPPSVAEVGTAIPAFIGHTEKAERNKKGDLNLKPTKIRSLKEYESLFGGPKKEDITITIKKDEGGAYKVTTVTVAKNDVTKDPAPVPSFLLYYAVKMYFDNGGGECYIVSVGGYDDTIAWDPTQEKSLDKGVAAVALEDEPTLIVIPEAVKLSAEKYTAMAGEVLKQCGVLRDRFGIFDIRAEAKPLDFAVERGRFGTSDLKYAAAYYPFLKTAMNYPIGKGETVMVTVEPEPATGTGGDSTPPAPSSPPAAASLSTFETDKTEIYNFVKEALQRYFITMPPSGAVAGVYAKTDLTRGVWKAPANVSLAGVIEPTVKLSDDLQKSLNVDATTGKSINAIRAFAGKGTLVWGARTLAGNDNEWRYVSVRRFYNMVEESVKKSTYWAVFEPNDANTWVKVRGMIENYLIDKWRDGALAGATPKDAFFVKCGLGTTMTAQDILEGRLNVEIGMAAVRPAEFIILKFSHKLQTS